MAVAAQDAGSPPAISLVSGPEQALADRAVAAQLKALHRFAPTAEKSEASAASYQKGDLAGLLSSSLFADEQILVFTDVENATDAFIDDFTPYVSDPLPGVWVVLRHGGGSRAQRVTRAVKSAGFPITKCDALKGARGDAQKFALVQEEAQEAGGSIDRDAAESLVAALGDTLGELLAAARQLVHDSGGHVTQETVHTYFRGRVEARPYEVADAIAKGNGTGALLLARQAAATGVAPVVTVAALATTFRRMAGLSAGAPPNELGMEPWMADRVRQDARGWSDEALGYAICRTAKADSDVKGGSRDAAGALELCLIDITRAFTAQSASG